MKRILVCAAAVCLSVSFGAMSGAQSVAPRFLPAATDGTVSTCGSGDCFFALTQVQHNGAKYDSVSATLTLTTAASSQCIAATVNTSHWVGIQDSGTRLVQAGFYYTATAGKPSAPQYFYEFFPSPSHLLSTTDLGFTPSAGDKLLFHLWYAPGVNGWGLQIQDLTKTTTKAYSKYKYADNNQNSALWINSIADIATERQNGSTNTQYPLVNDGQETFKQPTVHVQGASSSGFFENEPTESTASMYDSAKTLLESASAPDSNAYAYHTFKKCS